MQVYIFSTFGIFWNYLIKLILKHYCRIPSYFGRIQADEAAKRILDGVRKNYAEFSVPGYLLYLEHILR